MCALGILDVVPPPPPRRVAAVVAALHLAALAGACAANPSVRARPGPAAPPLAVAPASVATPPGPGATLGDARPARPPDAAPLAPAPDGGVAGAARAPSRAPPPRPVASPAAVRDPSPAPTGSPMPSPPATSTPPGPRPFAELVAALRADPAFADHLELLDAAVRAAPRATAAVRLERQPDLEAAARARVGRGTGWAVVTTYVEAGADARALRAAYLDFERVGEWTGKPSTTVLSRGDGVAVVRVDGLRSALGIRYGAKWTFEARALERPGVLAILSRQADDPATEAMLATRNLLLFVPEAGGVRVLEASDSVVDYEVPALLRNLAVGAVFAEMKARVAGLRGHWREYVGRPDGTSLAGQRAASR